MHWKPKQISNVQWKKFVEGDRVPELLRPHSDVRGGGGGARTAPEAVPGNGAVNGAVNGAGRRGNGALPGADRERERQRRAQGKDDGHVRAERMELRGQPTPPPPNHPPPPAPAPPSPPGHGMPGVAGSGGGGSGGGGKSGGSKVRGVPPSFGYVKRTTSSSGSGGSKGEARTAQVAAVPRTKLKASTRADALQTQVSGGTQTCTSDYKSYSLTGPAASQLSQSVRDRLMQGSHSLPRNATSAAAAADYPSSTGPHRPFRPSDGSLSDSNYTDLQSYYSSPAYSSWLRHSSHGSTTLPTRSKYEGMSEADSMESLSSLPALQQHRASLTHPRLLARDSARLNRSNSIRSTKSEKMYLQRGGGGGGCEDGGGGGGNALGAMSALGSLGSLAALGSSPSSHHLLAMGMGPVPHHHQSQPTSPTAGQLAQGASRFNYTMASISASASSHGISRASMSPYSGMTKARDDDVHGSSVSLVSTASSLYSTPEDKHAHEIRKLRKELNDAQEKVHTLTSQLSTNVSA
ncbi:Protein sickie [Frankliniella fusca]|uniref:Protein sickie n=1 Tax=Frankliniella fusca TaxID=407009 RepID=A0AAE1GR51_9NEOP|nr:Protein sickie [Frankliniella fusca]